MAQTYSTYEAKARFSEVMRKVRAGQRIVIAYRGQRVAEIRPIEDAERGLEKRLARLEDEGLLSPRREPTGALRPLARRAGALRRFLESRE
jgi:prevent-host-death family protein